MSSSYLGGFTTGSLSPGALPSDQVTSLLTGGTTAASTAHPGAQPSQILASFSPAERGTVRTLARALIARTGAGGLTGTAFARLQDHGIARHQNPMFAGCASVLAGSIAERDDDALFRGTVNDLLDMAGSSSCASALRGAFDSADLRGCSAGDRMQLLGMLAFSVGSCGPTIAQAQALLTQLAATQPPGCTCANALGCGGGSMSYQMTGQGTATVDLGDGYQLNINQANSEVDLVDKCTGNKTTIWGDPHMGVNGNNDQFQFKGNVTLNLPDGTKITLQTTPYDGNPNAFLTKNLVITRGSQAITVNNMDQNSADAGKMSIQQSNGLGQLERLANPDGTELYLNAAGNGWDVQDGLSMRPLTEQDLQAGDAAQQNGSSQLAQQNGSSQSAQQNGSSQSAQQNGSSQFAWNLGAMAGLLTGLLNELMASVNREGPFAAA